MSRYHLIRAIFDKVPSADRGINKSGLHVVSLNHCRIPMYATLERLSSDKLAKLAHKLGISAGETIS